MRRRRSSGRLIAALALVASALPSTPAAGQEPASEGALFLLLPIGARAVGTGQAIVADRPGGEAIWWNPSALAHAERTEAAIHHSQSIVATGDAVTIVVPSALLGVIAVGANILNFGKQEVRDTVGTLGVLLPRNIVYTASYATPVGRWLSAGAAYKIVQLRLDCSGGCAGIPTVSASSSAIDAGIQGSLARWAPVDVGIALRNVGPRLQVNDRDQADPLPTRLQVGVSATIPQVKRATRDLALRVNLDALDRVRFNTPSLRLGATLDYRDRAYLRGGFLSERGAGDGEGPSIGFGITSGSLSVDIARIMRGLSAESGEPPTFVSLRYSF
ncbi:MAG TPA: PorV/PorQ family protein [Gemmatimonadaceae bacterium]|nr:PorV/PorQ family protein [Gemmatimonadaceae bacterium]